ncbi:glycosyltransferase, partial [Escherichia coli]|nr:glycosyltransferase [Escherichia coli]
LLYLAAEREEFHVHIISEGTYRGKLTNIIDKFDLSQRVTLHGYISNASSMLGKFDVYVQPSKSEGFGIAVIEALVNKIPTVCSDIEVFRELFGSGEVEFFKLDDINSLYDAISSALTKTDMSRDASATAISQKFSSEVMSLNYLS